MKLLESVLAAWLFHCACAAPLDVEGERVLQQQNAQNAIPRLGRRSPAVDLPSFTSGYMPNLPAYLSQRNPKRAAVPASFGYGSSLSGYPYGFYPYGRRQEVATQQRPAPKRSAVAEDWSSAWDNVLRSPQGFRLHDGNSDYYSNFVMYKRAKDFLSELNSVPMLGKRDPEAAVASSSGATSNDDLESAEEGSDPVWASFPEEGGNIMGDASLYPSVVSPHLRTLLTRVQRSRTI